MECTARVQASRSGLDTLGNKENPTKEESVEEKPDKKNITQEKAADDEFDEEMAPKETIIEDASDDTNEDDTPAGWMQRTIECGVTLHIF